MLAFDRVGTGIPLVFIHAFPLSKSMWEAQKKVFINNFQFISFDMPGFGESPLKSDRTAMEEMADEVLMTLDELKITEKVIFTGVSMGGYVLLRLIEKAPHRIRGLVLTSTRSAGDTPEAREKRLKTVKNLETNGLNPLADTMIPNLLGKTSLKENSELAGWLKREILKASVNAVCAAQRGMAERPDSTSLLKDIKVPTLVISGREDKFIPTTEMESMAAQIPKSRLEIIENAGHLPNLERPSDFNDVFLTFLKRQLL